jgi:hypothetical protein
LTTTRMVISLDEWQSIRAIQLGPLSEVLEVATDIYKSQLMVNCIYFIGSYINGIMDGVQWRSIMRIGTGLTVV